MAAIMTGVIDELTLYLGINPLPMIWAAVIGTNAGGNITPIASAAGVQVISILNRETDKSRHLSFFEFFRVGVFVALITVIIGIVYVLILANFYY